MPNFPSSCSRALRVLPPAAWLAASLVLGAAQAPASEPEAAQARPHGQGSPRLIAYFTQWGIYGANFLAKDVAAEGIRVNAVRPGIIETDIHASGGLADRARQSAALIPMQRPGTADEVAQAIVWLLSDAASYTTGAILDVTGGR